MLSVYVFTALYFSSLFQSVLFLLKKKIKFAAKQCALLTSSCLMHPVFTVSTASFSLLLDVISCFVQ